MTTAVMTRSREIAAVAIGGELYSVDDAIAASAVLAEIDAGHEDGASRLIIQAGLDGLTNGQLEELASVFGVER